MRRMGGLGIALLALVCLLWLAGSQATVMAEGAEHGFVGASKCKMCHKKEEKGDQYGKWLASKHANAYKTLLTDAAKQVAQKAGVTGAPEEAGQCLGCHVTGHGAKAELLDTKYDKTEGVTCEGCHGAASDWLKDHKKDVETAKTLGFQRGAGAEMCKTCHNEKSPTFKAFDYEKQLAAIAHPDPTKK